MIALHDLPIYADRELIIKAGLGDDENVIPISEITNSAIQQRLMTMSTQGIKSKLAVAALRISDDDDYSLVVFDKNPKKNIQEPERRIH